MKVEFIKANENGTWSTEIIDVPKGAIKSKFLTGSPKWYAAINHWAERKLATQAQYRRVVYWGIYNEDPDVDS